MQIDYLADRPEHLRTLAEWFDAQWKHVLPDRTVETYVERFRTHMNRREMPLTLVAHQDGEALGTASLRTNDMTSRPEHTPWLGGVYVAAPHRRRGISAALIAAVEDRARELGATVLYLYTVDKESYYRGLGWEFVEHTEYLAQTVAVMRKPL
ncbi:MAG TPA: GNAT family N-acetyltransferase [Longimicrobiaceae bacterium]|jgi:GNAT superfamily N-acetyltransferase|nr:GNAT family N-acetyltransferase [Longimicrobiaceae bacterium]